MNEPEIRQLLEECLRLLEYCVNGNPDGIGYRRRQFLEAANKIRKVLGWPETTGDDGPT